MNRTHMTEDAKRAAKIEKKLKVLLGGYQVGLKITALTQFSRKLCMVNKFSHFIKRGVDSPVFYFSYTFIIYS